MESRRPMACAGSPSGTAATRQAACATAATMALARASSDAPARASARAARTPPPSEHTLVDRATRTNRPALREGPSSEPLPLAAARAAPAPALPPSLAAADRAVAPSLAETAAAACETASAAGPVGYSPAAAATSATAHHPACSEAGAASTPTRQIVASANGGGADSDGRGTRARSASDVADWNWWPFASPDPSPSSLAVNLASPADLAASRRRPSAALAGPALGASPVAAAAPCDG
mmetsp:Transcript_13950/g.53060  ORF Transcript_13950/g.53060 Transcript_13950/m.53060 type:complete len:237 (+) Transcript_13950:136-846(+)